MLCEIHLIMVALSSCVYVTIVVTAVGNEEALVHCDRDGAHDRSVEAADPARIGVNVM